VYYEDVCSGDHAELFPLFFSLSLFNSSRSNSTKSSAPTDAIVQDERIGTGDNVTRFPSFPFAYCYVYFLTHTHTGEKKKEPPLSSFLVLLLLFHTQIHHLTQSKKYVKKKTKKFFFVDLPVPWLLLCFFSFY
jgi:hypothetical protein